MRKPFKSHANLRQCCNLSSKCVRAVKRKRNSSTDYICGSPHEDNMVKTTSTQEMQKQSPIITEHDVIKVGGFNFISFDTI